MIKSTIFVLGNPVEPLDNSAIKLLPLLQKKFPDVDFIRFDPNEELPLEINKGLIIIDTVVGIKKVTKFNGLDSFTLSPRVTSHDYDLPISLGILKKLGKVKNITVIGIPANGNRKEILKQTTKIITASGI